MNLGWKKGTRRKRKKWDIQKRDFNFVLFEIGVVVYIRIAHTPSPQGVALFEKIMRCVFIRVEVVLLKAVCHWV